MSLIRLYRKTNKVIECYYLLLNANPVNNENMVYVLENIFQATELNNFHHHEYIEIGPRIGMISPWASNALTILHRLGLLQVDRIERSFLYLPYMKIDYDSMTEQIYKNVLTVEELTQQSMVPEKTNIIPLVELEKANSIHQFGMDEQDLAWYQSIFANREIQHLTDVEAFDLAQSNSEHSRHWLFRGKLQLGDAKFEDAKFEDAKFGDAKFEDAKFGDAKFGDDEDDIFENEFLDKTLFQLIKEPLQKLKAKKANDNSLVAMSDNSSAIRGYPTKILIPNKDHRFNKEYALIHPILTAETHNFPTGIAPREGSATGVGGRIRDIQGMGRGGQMMAGIAGYSVGNLPFYNLKKQLLDGKMKTKEIFRHIDFIPLNDRQLPHQFDYPLHKPEKILIEASNGASDYGNKIGEPMICGFTRSFGQLVHINSTVPMELCQNRIEYIKPIMFSGGIGQVFDEHLYKMDPDTGYLIVRLGGPAFRIGVGGGAASSRSQSGVGSAVDICAIQRDDAEMENRLNKVIRTCVEMGIENPILSIHDQGAGGMGNVTKEIVSEANDRRTDGLKTGGLISLGQVISGDSTLSAREKWIAEYQEQDTILIHPRSSSLIKSICQRENLPVSFIGVVTNDGQMTVYDPEGKFNRTNLTQSQAEMFPVQFDLNQVLNQVPQKVFKMSNKQSRQAIKIPDDKIPGDKIHAPDQEQLDIYIEKVLTDITVGSKRFLTNKVDRSVGGLVAQQQCVGPLHTPLSDYALVAQSAYGKTGICTAIGEQPIKGLLNPSAMARLTVGEMLTNLMWVRVSGLEDIKCSGNWMWEKKDPEEIYALYLAVESVSQVLKELGLAIDGGKDSLSMSAEVSQHNTQQRVLSPRTLVMTAYVTVPDITVKVTPNLKRAGNKLLYIDLGKGKNRLGGSVFTYQVNGNLGNDVPDLEQATDLIEAFNLVQSLLLMNDENKKLYDKQSNHSFDEMNELDENWRVLWSGHDRSDGGLITTLLEMSFAGNLGWEINLSSLLNAKDLKEKNKNLISVLFSEELGIVMEVSPQYVNMIMEKAKKVGLHIHQLGHVMSWKVNRIMTSETIGLPMGSETTLRRGFASRTTASATSYVEGSSNTSLRTDLLLYERSMTELRDIWEWSSFELERRQCNLECVIEEQSSLAQRNGPIYTLGPNFQRTNTIPNTIPNIHTVAIIREEGSNGDREMAVAFDCAGFSVHDVTMTDLLKCPQLLNQFRGLALVGGFSFADVLGAGRGWYLTIVNNFAVFEQFELFRHRSDTFSLGICNGCQVMSQLGWVPGRFERNTSGRFESRWSAVRINQNTNAVMLKDLGESILGVWVAHGEGRYVDNSSEKSSVNNNKTQIAIEYVNESGVNANLAYPDNPNGSYLDIGGVSSEDGRHLAMMPHPERTIKQWQAPWISSAFMTKLDHQGENENENENEYPWIRMFQNAYKFCSE